jgi:hypothetical protein
MVIDLKNVTIVFEDGTLKTGAVNLMAGYAIGVSTITVDGFTDKVPVGARLSIDGDDRYTVVSTTETLSATTSITFSPALVAAVLDNDVVIAYGVFLNIKVGDGTITWSEKKPRQYIKDRGRLDEVRNGDEEPMDVNFSMQYIELTASDPVNDPPTPEDALKQRGPASTWVSADNTDPCAPYCINIRLDHIPPNCTSQDKERVVLPMFYYEQLDHDPKAGTITCQGKCNATEAEVTRIAA